MKTVTLGTTGIEVSELCFGALPIGPLQKNVELDEASDVIAYALANGISYVDTAKMYQTYEHVRRAMAKAGVRPVLSSKSVAADYAGMERDVQEAVRALGVDVVDIFFVHAARAGEEVFTARSGAFAALADCKKKGLIRAVGLSTHHVRVTELAAQRPEVDVIFPILNLAGRGILGGTAAEMVTAIEANYAAGKGVVLMKALGGGSLLSDYQNAMDYCTGHSKARASLAVGMVSKAEVDMNLAYFNGEAVNTAQVADKRFIIVSGLCRDCGACAETCPNGAIEQADGHRLIDAQRCLTCGYCVGACGEFAIRMI